MQALLVTCLAVGLTACTIERVGPPGVVMTHPIRVKARDVQVFETADLVKGRFSVVDDLFVEDNGDDLPR